MRKDPLWKVRLAFGGEPFETDDGPVGRGFVTLTVRVPDVPAARRAGLDEGKKAVRELNSEAVVLWSVNAVEPGRRRAALKLHLYEEAWTLRPAPLADLARDLQDDELVLQIADGSLHVPPGSEDTFGVEIRYEELEYTARTEGWHAHLGEEPQQAVALFQWLLTPFYRLVRESQGGEPSASWIERYEAEGWAPYHPVLFRNPSDPTRWLGGGWHRAYRQQDARPLRVPYGEIEPGAALDARGFPEGTVLGTVVRTFDRPLAEAEEWLTWDYSFDPGRHDPPLGFD